MSQLSDELIQEMCEQYQPKAKRINYGWMTETSGCFDCVHEFMGNKFCMREFINKGRIVLLANREWVEDPVQNLRLPEWMREPWGTYPNLPPKPPKE